nr:MAG TPA: hypothetical protein [Caudoviricetes sp.]
MLLGVNRHNRGNPVPSRATVGDYAAVRCVSADASCDSGSTG